MKMFWWKSVIATICIFLSNIEGKIPSFKPCYISDPDINTCLKTTADVVLPYIIDGIPEMDIKSLRAFKIDDVHEKLPAIQLDLINNTLYSGKSKVNSFNLDLDKKVVRMKATADGFLTSNYTINGRLIIFPVQGKGKSRIELTDVHFDLLYEYDLIKKNDGMEYMKLGKQESSITPSFIGFNFENLFEGNKELARTVAQFMNENWEILYKEFGGTFAKEILKIYRKQIGKFFSNTPFDNIVIR